jgi:hypothetical protein
LQEIVGFFEVFISFFANAKIKSISGNSSLGLGFYYKIFFKESKREREREKNKNNNS